MGYRMIRRLRSWGLPVALGWLVSASAAQEPAGPTAPALTEEQVRLNVESFDKVWVTIKDEHFDPKLEGVDWEAVKAELRPRVEAATTAAEARAALTQMIERLGQSHFAILPQSVHESMENVERQRRPGEGVIGVEVRVVDGEALVVSVAPGQPAAKAGVEPGWEILGIDGTDLAPILAKVSEAYEDSTQLDLKLATAVEARLSGDVGDEVPVKFRDRSGEAREIRIPLGRPKGQPTTFGNLPTFYVHIDEREVGGDIPYIGFNAFFDPSRVVARVGEYVSMNLEAPGLILDLRGNPGGIGAIAMGIGGWFFDRSGQKFGSMITRDTTLRFTILPRPDTYRGPLAVLVDGCSASTAEILAGGLQDLGRARIFGTRTAGAALPSMVVRLPNGDAFQFAFANYVSEGGKALEGVGVTPDEVAAPSRQALLDGHDPALEAAIAWIHAQAPTGASASNGDAATPATSGSPR